MYKNNRTLKILYKCIKANTSAIWAAYAAHTTNYSTHLLTTPKKTKEPRATQNSLPFGKWRFRGGKRSEARTEAEMCQTERATIRLGRRTREEIKTQKWDWIDSPEIPDRGVGHQNRRPPFGGDGAERKLEAGQGNIDGCLTNHSHGQIWCSLAPCVTKSMQNERTGYGWTRWSVFRWILRPRYLTAAFCLLNKTHLGKCMYVVTLKLPTRSLIRISAV